MTDTEPTLRDRLAEDEALRLNGPANDGRGWYRNDTERTQCYMRADAVLAVVQPELDQLTAEAASLRTVARAAAVLLHDTADRASGGIAIHAGVLRGAAKAIDDIAPDGS